jgi:ABC-2 type transport system permease protein
MFLVAMITFYAGVLVWKGRDTRMDEIHDALPIPDWLSYASRLAALIVIVMLVQAVAMASGIVVQTCLGYHRYQIGLYLKELFLRDASFFLFSAVLAFFIHAIAPNKYVGYFAFIAFLILNAFIWRPLNVATYLVRFGMRPSVTNSDFFGDAPFRAGVELVHAVLAAVLRAAFDSAPCCSGRAASRTAGGSDCTRRSLRFHGALRPLALVCLLLFAATGAWIAYNTMVLNPLFGPKDLQRQQADYEKTYKPLDKLPQPRGRSVKYAIDIYPESRNMVMRGESVIYNPYSQPLGEVHFSVNRDYTTQIEIPGAAGQRRPLLGYRIYRFTAPLEPGESRTMRFTVSSRTRGFENSVSDKELVQNGTFFNNTSPPSSDTGATANWTTPTTAASTAEGHRPDARLERNCTADCIGKLHRRPFRLGGCGHRDRHFARSDCDCSRLAGARVARRGRPALFRIQARPSFARILLVHFRVTRWRARTGTASSWRFTTSRSIPGMCRAC